MSSENVPRFGFSLTDLPWTQIAQSYLDGNALPLMRHLVEERGMTADELDELRRLVDQLEQR